MKIIIALTTTLLSSTAAFAGTVAYIAPEVTMIEEPSRMGGSGAWLVPLVIIAVLALVLTQKEDEIIQDDQQSPPPFIPEKVTER